MLPNPKGTFESLQARVKETLERFFPVEAGQYKLEASNFKWLSNEAFASDFRDAKLRDKSITAPLKGDFTLYKDGKPIVSKRNYTILNMPTPTDLNSFIMDGKEVQIINQQRLRPGIYSRLVAGNKVETFINTAGGNYRIFMDRDSAVFKLRLGTTHFSLYSVLTALGVTDSQMREAWGAKVFEANKRDVSKEDIHTILGEMYRKLRPFSAPSETTDLRRIEVKSFLESKALDADVSKITLGTPYDKVTAEALLSASKKAVEISKGEKDADNTEDMGFKQILTYDTLLLEALQRILPVVRADLVRRIKRKQDIDYIFATDAINGVLKRFFLTSEFTRYTDQNNPLDILNTQQSITIMGSGGISSMHSVSDDLRQVHPSSIGFEDLVHTPEGSKIGLTTHASILSSVVDGKPAIELLTPSGKEVTIKVVDLRDKAIGFRSEFDSNLKPKNKMIRAKVGDVIKMVDKVDYIYPTNYGLFGLSSIGIPFADSNSPNRVMMADRHLEQAVPLKYREAPVVDTSIDGESYASTVGHVTAVTAQHAGTVLSVSKNRIKVKRSTGPDDDDYPLYNDYPLNSGAVLSHTPRVKKGDKVKAGDILATTNFHDKDGNLAMGVHLRTAFMPYKGLNFEDAVVISESAAKKLTSEHMYTLVLELDRGVKIGKATLISEFPAAANFYKDMSKYDSDGIVNKGVKVYLGEMLIPAIKKMEIASALDVDKFGKLFRNTYMDVSLVWDSKFPGEIIDVVRTRTAYKVLIKTEEPMQVGDKLSVRAAAKGIVSAVIDDKRMPHDDKGRPMDMLLNPGGIGGRINPGQLLEAFLGKVFFDRGMKPKDRYKIEAFSGQDNLEMVRSELRKHRIKDVETLHDPVDNRDKDAAVGMIHVYKLKHQIRKKFNARGHGAYTTDEQPAKLHGESAQRLSSHELYALLAHGATSFMRDAATIKSQKNDEYWQALQQGLPLPPVDTPFVVKKFKTFVEGAGIQLDQTQKVLKVLPMTDKEILERSTGAITSPMTIRATDFKPEKGGLYDEEITGGVGGTKWSRIDLAEPMPNPIFEKPIVSLLGLTVKDFEAIMEGTKGVDNANAVVTVTNENKGSLKIGGMAIAQMLRALNVDTEIKSVDQKISTASPINKPKLEYRRKLLRALKKMDMRPDEAYINRHVAVIPPKFRQLYSLDDGNIAVSDPVHGYREVILLNNGLKELKNKGVDDYNTADIRAGLYNAIKGMVGISEPLTRSKDFRGFVAAIKGPENKRGLFQGMVVRRTQDLTGRSTVIPDANLNLDEAGIPKKMALVIYRDFIMNEMSKAGIPALESRDMVEKAIEGEDVPQVNAALQAVVQDRPVLLNRQPTLHKFGLLAFKPKIVDGEAIQTNPLIVSGFNLDHDGDQIIASVIVGISDDVSMENMTFGVGSELRGTILSNKMEGKMSARFDVSVPMTNMSTYVMHLDAFPHTDYIKTTKGRCGLIEWYKVPDGVYVLAMDEKTHKLSWQHPTVWSVHRGCPVEIVTLLSGRQILTDDDPRAVFGIKKGTLEYARMTPSDAVNNGMLVPRAKYIDTPATECHIMVDAHKYHIENPLPLTADIGYFAGVMAGDGWVTGRKHGSDDFVVVASIHEEIPQKLDGIFESLLGTPVARSINNNSKGRYNGSAYGTSIAHYYTNKLLASISAQWVGKGAHNKHLPGWFLTAPEECRLGLFAGLMDTGGSIAIVKAEAKKRKQLSANFSSTSLRLIQEVQILAMSIGIRGRITPSKTPAGNEFWQMTFSSVDIKAWGGKYMVHPAKLKALIDAPYVNTSMGAAVRVDMVPISYDLARSIRTAIGCPRNASKEHKSLYQMADKAIERGALSRATALRYLQDPAIVSKIRDHSDYEIWRAIVDSTSIAWDAVVSYDKTDRVEVGFDLTVPGFETFMGADGIILSNTMGVHVPVSEEARKEALTKLLPSQNLLNPRDGKVIHVPSKEALLGLWLMTNPKGDPKDMSPNEAYEKYMDREIKANQAIKYSGKLITPGQVILSRDIKGYELGTVIDKKVAIKMINDMAMKNTDDAADLINKFKDYGYKYATEIGWTVGLDDLSVPERQRASILKNVNKGTKAFADVATELGKLVDAQKDNRFVQGHITSGAFGKGDSIRQLIAAPVAVTDFKGNIVTQPITRSYAQGLDIGSYISAIPGSRKGMMDRGLSTAETGWFSKEVMATAAETIIAESDCGTSSGIALPIDHNDIVDRVVARGELNAGSVVTPQMVNMLKLSGKKTLKVRSPMTCGSLRGVCQKCFGLDETGQFPKIGEYIGVKAAHAITEPTMQMTLSSFHHGSSILAKSLGFNDVQQALRMPSVISHEKVIAMKSGTVKRIEKAPAGGWIIWVDNVDHYVSPELNIAGGVRVGAKVTAGDPLSDRGFMNPHTLLDATGDIGKVRDAVINRLDEAYRASGVNVKRRIYETVVKPMTDRSIVTDAGKSLELVSGDTVSTAEAEKLKSQGVKTEPVILPLGKAPFHSKDFIGALTFQRLGDTLRDAASQGKHIDLDNAHPVTQYVLSLIGRLKSEK